MALSVDGFRAGGVTCGIKPSGKPDLAVIVSDRPATAAAVFTRNRFPGAPVHVSKRHLRAGVVRGVVVNSGISNVATGDVGLADARAMCGALAESIGAKSSEIQVASTGVIGRPLPMDKILPAIPNAVRVARPNGWRRAAEAILTTDLKVKIATASSQRFSLLGIAKGSGMIQPNMATMLSYIATDLAVERDFLAGSLRDAVGPTFNALTIDGDTSTSDTVLVMANGAAGNRPVGGRSAAGREFARALGELCAALCEQLALDGEGVTRIATIDVNGARSNDAADRIARSVANSQLFKTALFGADPNWGRIVQSAGKAGVPIDTRRFGVRIGGVDLGREGALIDDPTALRRAEREMKRKRVPIEITVGRGPGRARILTTDLTYEYVRINAEYTT